MDKRILRELTAVTVLECLRILVRRSDKLYTDLNVTRNIFLRSKISIELDSVNSEIRALIFKDLNGHYSTTELVPSDFDAIRNKIMSKSREKPGPKIGSKKK